jgi:hypothetical protein
MGIQIEPRKLVRIIAYNKANIQHMRTVNVLTTAPAKKEFPERLQAAGVSNPLVPTVMAASPNSSIYPSIYVAGYSGPA